MVNAEPVTPTLKLGEGPHWDVESQTLYYVDLMAGTVHRYTPSTNIHASATLGEHCSFIIPIDGAPNKFITGSKRDIQITTWDGVSRELSSEKIGEVDCGPGLEKNVINDAKCDALGRLWTGTIMEQAFFGKRGPNTGSLYSLSADRELKPHLGSVLCSNGLGWNSDNTIFYYTDTVAREIYKFDFDLEAGTINNKTVVFSPAELDLPGYPDGLTIDSDGNIWTAMFGTNHVIQINPNEKNTILRQIVIPGVKQVTSVTFGGENLDELFVTTGRAGGFGLGDDFTEYDGAIHRITELGVRGVPAVKAKIA